MKRQTETGQLRPHEFEALEDESEDMGSFARADPEVLATRRRLKISRNPPGSSTAASQPLPSTGGLFSGISLTKAAPQKENVVSFSSLTKQPPATADRTTKHAVTKGSANAPKPELADLNRNFLHWLERHLARKPVSIWKEAMQDYIEYAKELVPADDTPAAHEDGGSDDEVQVVKQLPPQSKPSPVVAELRAEVAAAPPSKPAASQPDKPASAFSFGDKSAPKTDTPAFKFGSLAPAAKPAASPAASPAATDEKPAAKPFSFGSLKPATDSDSKPAATTGSAFSGFKLGAFGGSAGAKPAAATAAAGAPAKSAFSFGAGATGFGAKTTPAAPVATSAPAAEGADGDDEGMPYEAPAEVLKNEADTDEILHEVDCKLFKLADVADEAGNVKKEWRELGKGSFRITRNPDTQKTRMLVRNTLGKPTLNSYLLAGQKFTKKGKNIMFSAAVGDGVLQGMMLKVKPEHVDETVSKLEQHRPSS